MVFDAAAAADVEVLEDLAARGMRLLPYEEARTYTYDYILMDYNFSYNEIFRSTANIAPAKIIGYAHGTDRGMGVREGVDFFIFHNEMQLRSIAQEKLVYCDKDGVPCAAVLKNSGIECAWSGLYHFGESVALRHADKKV